MTELGEEIQNAQRAYFDLCLLQRTFWWFSDYSFELAGHTYYYHH